MNNVRPNKLSQVDTGKGSLLHILYPILPGSRRNAFLDYALPFAILASLLYVIPVLVVWKINRSSIIFPSNTVTLPLLWDFNITYMFLVSAPLIAVFLLNERKSIPGALDHMIQAGSIRVTKHEETELCGYFENVFFKANLIGQFLGIVVGISIGLFNSVSFFAPEIGHWGRDGKELSRARLIWLCFQLPFFGWLVTFYIIRHLAIMRIFLKLTKAESTSIRVDPFHHDKAGGLSAIGEIGLRNQWILMVVGINLVISFIVYQKLITIGYLIYLFWIFLGIVYIICGPLVFVAPLLPFRPLMLEAKEKVMREYCCQVKSFCETVEPYDPGRSQTEHAYAYTRYLRDVEHFVENIPVWPFDHHTLRRFLVAYATPLATALLPTILGSLGNF